MRWMIVLFFVMVISACGKKERLVEKVFVVNISPGADSLAQYLRYHESVWPEVEQGFRKAGYHQIRMYRSQHTLVMVITVPEGADLGEMGKKAEAYHSRCAEWNRLMSGYQRGVEGSLPGQTWTEALPFYDFENK